MKSPLWLIALGLTTTMQMVGSFMNQSLPVVAPLLTAGIGVGAEQIGYLYALNSLGSVIFLAFGTPIVLRLGAVRSLQISVLAGAASLALLAVGIWPMVVAAALLLGLAYGPAPTASTGILAATAPARHRGLIFSIKQAGAQVGGVLAGFLVAPLAVRFGWAWALAAGVMVGVVAGIGITPLQRRLDVVHDQPRAITPRALFHWQNLRVPFAAIGAERQLVALTVLTTSFAVTQGCLFSFCVTYLVTTRGMGLQAAGIAYACMQGGAMVGRVFLGWMSDRSGRAMRNMLGQAWAAAALAGVWAVLPGGLGLGVVGPLAFAAGMMVASWNGLMLAEIARLAPPDRVADAAAGSTMISFSGYVLGPVLFALAVRGFGGWQTPYLLVAAQVGLVALVQTAWLMRHESSFHLAADASHGVQHLREDVKP